MSKISLETLSEVLQEEGVEQPKQIKILDHLKEILKAEQEKKEDNKTPKSKNEFGVVLFAPELVGKEYTACIYQVKDGFDHGTVLTKISEAARNQNNNKKSKKNVIQSIGEAFQNLNRKWIKEKQINFKTKESVRVLITDNKLV
jgi:hypothetical protein